MTTEYFLLARWQALTVAVGVVVVAGGAGLALAAPEVAAAGTLARHGVAAAVRGGGALQRALARLATGVTPPAEQTNIRILSIIIIMVSMVTNVTYENKNFYT